MKRQMHRTAGGRKRLVATAVTVAAAVAATLALSATSGGARSGGSGGHARVPSPAGSPGVLAPRGASDPVNPWTLNNPRYFSYLQVPVGGSPAPSNDLVIPDAEQARLLALIEAGVPFTHDPGTAAPSNDLVIPDAERARLLALIEAGVPLTAHPTTTGGSGTGG